MPNKASKIAYKILSVILPSKKLRRKMRQLGELDKNPNFHKLKHCGTGSVIEVVNVLREAGAEVLGIVSIFTYGMQKGLDRLAAAEVKNVSLTDFDCIAEVAAQEGYIKTEDIKRLIAFRNNPSDESWIGANG